MWACIHNSTRSNGNSTNYANTFSVPINDTNCNRNGYGHTYCHCETYTNPKDRSYAKSSANARTAPVASKVDLLGERVFRTQPTRLPRQRRKLKR